MTLQDALDMVRAAGYTVSTKAKPAKPGTALDFHTEFQLAKDAAVLELGDRWFIVPGASQWIIISSRLANYRFARVDGSESVTIRNPRDYRAPAPRFWKGGKLPAGVTVASDPPTGADLRAVRHRAETLSAWLDYRAAVAKAMNLCTSPYRRSGANEYDLRDQSRTAVREAWHARRRLVQLEKHGG